MWPQEKDFSHSPKLLKYWRQLAKLCPTTGGTPRLLPKLPGNTSTAIRYYLIYLVASSDHMKIVVLGYIVRGPLGGMAWHHFQYVLGLLRLGHDVLFLEESGNYPSCYNPEKYETSTDCSYGLTFVNDLFQAF